MGDGLVPLADGEGQGLELAVGDLESLVDGRDHTMVLRPASP